MSVNQITDIAAHYIQMVYQFTPKPYSTRIIQSIWIIVLFFVILLIPALLLSDGYLPEALIILVLILMVVKAGFVFVNERYALQTLSADNLLIKMHYYDKNELCVTSFPLTELQIKLGYTISRVPKPYLSFRQNNKHIGTFYENIPTGFNKTVVIEMHTKLLQLQSEHNHTTHTPS